MTSQVNPVTSCALRPQGACRPGNRPAPWIRASWARDLRVGTRQYSIHDATTSACALWRFFPVRCSKTCSPTACSATPSPRPWSVRTATAVRSPSATAPGSCRTPRTASRTPRQKRAGRHLLRQLLQDHLDLRARGEEQAARREVRPQVAGSDGRLRPWRETRHARRPACMLGLVRVERVAVEAAQPALRVRAVRLSRVDEEDVVVVCRSGVPNRRGVKSCSARRGARPSAARSPRPARSAASRRPRARGGAGRFRGRHRATTG